jgi:sugar phosphate isomerase/epimerase
MNIGLFTPVFGRMCLSDMLVELKRYPQITSLELGTGGWPGSSHLDVDQLMTNPAAAREFISRLRDAGFWVSALSCHGNPVHPLAEVAERDDRRYRKTVALAELLRVPTVVTFSGCPGGSAKDCTPNWVTAAWPPEFVEALNWQWEERLIPYWRNAAAFAADHGVQIALEAHPGFCVYNPETLLRLRSEAGETLGINLDPSHLWWQGIDIPSAIAELGKSIHHVHAKDVLLNQSAIARNGLLDTKSYLKMQERAWTFRTVGWGHDELQWKTIISALRLAGYDSVLSIEHEDAVASIHEGLENAVSFLGRIILRQPPAESWWV